MQDDSVTSVELTQQIQKEQATLEAHLQSSCFRVASRCCSQCLFGPNKVVSEARKTALLEECLRTDQFFRCHVGDAKGQTICCRGFFEIHGRDVFPVRIARLLNELFSGSLRFVEVEEDMEQKCQL